MGVKNRDESSSLLTLMHDVENISRVAAKAIEPRDDKLVSFPQKFYYRGQLVAPIATAARDFF